MPSYFRLDEISKHKKAEDMWFIVDHKVYNVTKYVDEHPGGPVVLCSVAGGDASNGFKSNGHSDSAKEDLEKLCIGEVHPDDISKLKAPIQGTKSNPMGIAVVFVLIAILAFCIIHSL